MAPLPLLRQDAGQSSSILDVDPRGSSRSPLARGRSSRFSAASRAWRSRTHDEGKYGGNVFDVSVKAHHITDPGVWGSVEVRKLQCEMVLHNFGHHGPGVYVRSPVTPRSSSGAAPRESGVCSSAARWVCDSFAGRISQQKRGFSNHMRRVRVASVATDRVRLLGFA